LKTTAKRPLLS